MPSLKFTELLAPTMVQTASSTPMTRETTARPVTPNSRCSGPATQLCEQMNTLGLLDCTNPKVGEKMKTFRLTCACTHASRSRLLRALTRAASAVAYYNFQIDTCGRMHLARPEEPPSALPVSECPPRSEQLVAEEYRQGLLEKQLDMLHTTHDDAQGKRKAALEVLKNSKEFSLAKTAVSAANQAAPRGSAKQVVDKLMVNLKAGASELQRQAPDCE